MEVARLAIVLSAEEAKRQSQELSKELAKVGTITDRSTKQAQDGLNRLSGGISITARQFGDMSAAVLKLNPELSKLSTEANKAAGAIGGGGGSGIGGGGNGGGNGSGGGLRPAAGAAANSFNSLTASILKMIGAFLSIRQVVRATEAVVEARIQMDRLEFGLRAVTGSWEKAGQEIDFFSVQVKRLGINFQETIKDFVKIEAAFTQSGFSARQAERIFVDVATVTKALGLSSATTGRILYDFQEMASLGTVQLRQLRMVIMQVPGGLEIAARALGVTTQEFHRLLHEGLIPASEFIPKFTTELSRTFGSAMNEATHNLESNVERMKTAWFKLKAEIGKAPEIKAAVGAVGGFIEKVAIQQEFQNFVSQQGGNPLTPTRQEQQQFLTTRFPQVRGPGPGRIDLAEEYNRMRLVQEIINRQRKQAEEAAAPPKVVEPSEHQIEAYQRAADLLEKFNIEQLEGLEKQEAQIDLNAQKALDTMRKLFIGLTKEQQTALREASGGSPFEHIVQSAEVEKTLLRRNNALKIEAENAAEVTAEYKKVQEALEHLTIEAMGPNEAAIARVNEQFRKQSYILIELGESAVDTTELYEKLAAARDKALKEIEERRNRAGFTGETVSQLRAGIRADERALLTESDAEKFQQATQRMQDRSAELARRMKADAVSVSDAWKVGWEGATKAFGSFSERVAQGAAGLADTLDRNFTDAFSSMILGTKSASDAFRQMTTAILSDLTRILVRQLIVAPALQAIGGLFGGSSVGQSFGGSFGGGGLFGGGGTGSAAVTGANIGASVGFSKQFDRVAEAAAGRKQPPVNITLINASNPRDIDDHLAANPGAILNPIQRNASTVRRLLA